MIDTVSGNGGQIQVTFCLGISFFLYFSIVLFFYVDQYCPTSLSKFCKSHKVIFTDCCPYNTLFAGIVTLFVTVTPEYFIRVAENYVKEDTASATYSPSFHDLLVEKNTRRRTVELSKQSIYIT